MNKCGFTVTGTRMRYDCFLRQLQAFSLILHSTLHTLFYTTDGDIRATVRERMASAAVFEAFRAEILLKCPDIDEVVRATIVPYAYLMGIEAETRESYMEQLWMFCTRLVYERPVLVGPDTLDGTYNLALREAMQHFVSEQIPRPGKAGSTVKKVAATL